MEPHIDFWSVERMWPGETVAILAGGQSLTQEQADHCRGRCRVIAINRAGLPRPAHHAGRWVSATWADMLWASDVDRFWVWHPEAIEFAGIKVVVRKIAPSREDWRRYAALAERGVKVIKHSSHKHPGSMGKHEGTSGDPGIVHGNNALHMILSVLPHTGAATALLLGADMHGQHWHGGYRNMGPPTYATSCIPNFATLVKPLARAGVTVLNCSPGSALPSYWPHMRLEDVL